MGGRKEGGKEGRKIGLAPSYNVLSSAPNDCRTHRVLRLTLLITTKLELVPKLIFGSSPIIFRLAWQKTPSWTRFVGQALGPFLEEYIVCYLCISGIFDVGTQC